MRGATSTSLNKYQTGTFQPTLPVRGATRRRAYSRRASLISTHAPRAGSDLMSLPDISRPTDFNPRSPCGERRDGEQYEHIDFTISTHAPRAGSDLIAVFLSPPCYISTHAPRAGSDLMHRMLKMSKNDFNPRSPCGERLSSDGKAPIQLDFNPRSPCGERRPILQQFGLMHNFNPRSPCGERLYAGRLSAEEPGFQPTLPVRGATVRFYSNLDSCTISTHAPRAGSDEH